MALLVLGLLYLIGSVAVAGLLETECSLWNASAIPAADSSTRYDSHDVTSSVVKSGACVCLNEALTLMFHSLVHYRVHCYISWLLQRAG